ncbi:hypothetical protein [Leptodesmis sp.]
MTECNSGNSGLPYDFYPHRFLVVCFSNLELSSEAEILLERRAEQ